MTRIADGPSGLPPVSPAGNTEQPETTKEPAGAPSGQGSAYRDAIAQPGDAESLKNKLFGDGEKVGLTSIGWNPVSAVNKYIESKVVEVFDAFFKALAKGGKALGDAQKKLGKLLGEAEQKFPGQEAEVKKAFNQQFRKQLDQEIKKNPELEAIKKLDQALKENPDLKIGPEDEKDLGKLFDKANKLMEKALELQRKEEEGDGSSSLRA